MAKTLSNEFLRAVGDYMLVETPLARADMCLVFGCVYVDALAEKVIDLFEKKYFNQIVVSGGVLAKDGMTEAEYLHKKLTEAGIPSNSILIENAATNTGENVVNTMRLLTEQKKIQDVQSVMGVGYVAAARRFLMTMERHWPEVTKMFAASNPYAVDKNDWHEDENFKSMVLSEHAKIPPYKEIGYIREIDLKAMGQRIALLRQKHQAGCARKQTP